MYKSGADVADGSDSSSRLLSDVDMLEMRKRGVNSIALGAGSEFGERKKARFHVEDMPQARL